MEHVPQGPEDPLAQRRLTAPQERDLVIAAECGDAAARRKLVETFVPAIANLARGFHSSRVERRELLQEGVAGLLLAARRYDAGLGTPFWAYASFWVRKAMQELTAELARPVALSDRAVRELSPVRRTRNEHLQRHGTEPTTAELSHATGLGHRQVERLRATERMPLALEARLSESASMTVGDDRRSNRRAGVRARARRARDAGRVELDRRARRA